MGRKLKEVSDGGVAVLEPVEAEGAAKSKPFKFMGVTINPYIKSEGLPESVTSGKTRRAGEPRFELYRHDQGYDLMSVYNSGKGVGRKLAKTLRPDKVPADRELLGRLRSAGVLGS